MALSAPETSTRRPSTVAIHDARDMARDARHVDVINGNVVGMVREVLVELIDVVMHQLDLHDLCFFGLEHLIHLGDELIGGFWTLACSRRTSSR